MVQPKLCLLTTKIRSSESANAQRKPERDRQRAEERRLGEDHPLAPAPVEAPRKRSSPISRRRSSTSASSELAAPSIATTIATASSAQVIAKVRSKIAIAFRRNSLFGATATPRPAVRNWISCCTRCGDRRPGAR